MTSAPRNLSFGAAAEEYERYRPGYPEAVADLVLAYAARPVRTALEIGAGTGKATRLFAARGIAVTAVEPDAVMLAVLRRAVPDATPVLATFEDAAVEGRVDLVFSAAALHWTRPEGRWERVASLLAPGGVFACFGGAVHVADAALAAQVRAARAPWLGEDDVPSPDGTAPEAPLQWPGTELVASPLFADVQQHVIRRRWPMPAREFLGYLGTVSAYLGLPEVDRAAALAAIGGVLPDAVPVAADVMVHLARRE